MMITYKDSPEFLKIYINNRLHLMLAKNVIGIQSWKHTSGCYCIEFSYSNGSIKSEYESIELWVEILNVLNEIF